ncbi:GNAT family N-acetyltransferase [Campylobacter concisus]|uniref:GNAT family N-acetyltransferase n=1 Tax=Campylobacter concisus TaxID=199 RepID=UPI000D315656|nr:GNAT family N-acetyltransferase [Campylobacter concisus]
MIEQANLSDLETITQIYNEYILEKTATADMQPASTKEREPWFKAHNNSRPIFVYKENGEILGWCSLSDFNPKIAYKISVEISIYVAKKALGMGIGNQLLSHSLDEAKRLNLKNIIALIFSENKASLGLFLKFGFEKWGELPGVCLMDNEYKDVVILGLKL